MGKALVDPLLVDVGEDEADDRTDEWRQVNVGEGLQGYAGDQQADQCERGNRPAVPVPVEGGARAALEEVTQEWRPQEHHEHQQGGSSAAGAEGDALVGHSGADEEGGDDQGRGILVPPRRGQAVPEPGPDAVQVLQCARASSALPLSPGSTPSERNS